MHNYLGVPAIKPAPIRLPSGNGRSMIAETGGSIPVSYGNAKEAGWRSLGPNGMGRELPAAQHDKMIALSFKLWRTNPMAKRLIEMQINFVLGNGITVTSQDKSIVQALHRWWTDPYNRWPQRIMPRLRDLYIYGEWLHRPLVTPDGFVRIADVQPDIIAHVTPEKYDHGVIDTVYLRQVHEGGQVLKEYPVDVIRQRFRGNGDFLLEDTFSGSLHYFGINKTSDTMRGIGELLPLIDYIDMYDDMVFTTAEQHKVMGQFYYDLLVDGMQEDEMTAFVESHTNLPPRPASVFAHNAQMTLTPTAPKLNASDQAESVRMLKSFIVACYGYPGTWFDDPGSAGRAVGGEMAEPALRNIVNLQSTVGGFLRDEMDYYLEQLELANGISLPQDRDNLYTISFSKPSARDLPKIGPALGRMADFIEKMNKNFVLTQDEQRTLIASQVNQLGLSDAPLSMELPGELVRAKAEAETMAADAAKAKNAAATMGPVKVPGAGGASKVDKGK